MTGGTDDLLDDIIRRVDPADWVAAAQGARDEGFDRFDWLDATDDIGRADTVTVVCRLQDRTGRAVRLRTGVSRRDGVLPSLATVFPGAGWCEREAGEGFAVTFDGGDPRRLLLAPDAPEAPLLKDHLLAARVAVPWPGATEPGEGGRSRRRMVPPGVPDPAVWGDRDPAAGPADAEDIAAGAAGGRVRRSRDGERGGRSERGRGSERGGRSERGADR
ncbi:NADH-quinone oxidoreductase subunit C [Raineyella sp.]|uniref:NADH-quinone oxidoreductase subunit C n=1 Tax=Raineyella sp. TaxID=1911550 RepID=UPI002B1F8C4B|nr:NADH-quinone oxidoreductase subunit C [Raineyella sp.]MEA5155709.1 NADH-quinone oxidoreductase subunit C [Raineyella sp.]